jgi:hypothetical protein
VWFNITEKFVLFSFLFRLFRIYVSIWIRTTGYSGYLKTYIEVVHMSSKIEGGVDRTKIVFTLLGNR